MSLHLCRHGLRYALRCITLRQYYQLETQHACKSAFESLSIATSAIKALHKASHFRRIHNGPVDSDTENGGLSWTSKDLKNTFQLLPATHDLDALSDENIGETVSLHGYLGSRSDLKQNLSFVPLINKDLDKSIQVVSSILEDGSGKDVHEKIRATTTNSPVVVTGIVRSKPRPKKPRGQADITRIEHLEISLLSLDVLNTFPIDINFQADTKLPIELRHLQIRQNKGLRDALKMRNAIIETLRTYLRDQHRFLEVETPLLFKSTPEGAREFLVPTRQKGFAYALPQSPQQYKQILMASGVPKYFQIAKCFRDEDLRADRQPEFTQLDIEMSFANSNDVMKCIEGLIQRLWISLFDDANLTESFPRMSYQDAMARFGSDKPDLRFDMEITRIEHMIPAALISKIGPLANPAVEAFRLKVSEEPQITRRFVASFMESPDASPFLTNPEGQPGIFVYDSRKPLGGLQPFGFEAAERLEQHFELEEGDLVVIQARKNAPFSGGSTPLGNLRLAIHKAAVQQHLIAPLTGWKFLWINNFPLFSPATASEPGQGGSTGLAATHHPFTAPVSLDDIGLLATDPLSVKADHYDLVLNGVELGGGSRRIHDPRLQEYILRQILGLSDKRMENFAHLIDVLRTGCPPHAGIALGLDRLCAMVLGKESIRDVIAFPKTGSGEDPLVKSPGALTESQLSAYHLRLIS